MAPSESTILTNYLLLPAPLPSIISQQQFVALFPKALQSSTQVRALYRDLQQQRNTLVDSVADSIDVQTRISKGLRRSVVNAQREAEEEEQDDEIEIERALFGPTSTTTKPKRHNLMTILPDMEAAASDIEQQIQQLEEEESAILESVKQTVGDMSDLRYGRLANSKLRTDILESLQSIQETCKQKT